MPPRYEANRAAFLARLRAKLAEWEARLAPLRAMPMVAYHNSWPYFARRFRLDFVGFIETKPGVPPSPAHLAGIVQYHAARGVRIVVREPHEPERDVAFVARKAGRVDRDAGRFGRRAAGDRRLHLAVRRQCRGAEIGGGAR